MFRQAKIHLTLFIVLPTAFVLAVILIIIAICCYRRKQLEKKDAMVEQLCNVSC